MKEKKKSKIIKILLLFTLFKILINNFTVFINYKLIIL